MLNVNQTFLSVGNGQRDALYTALYGLRGGTTFQSLAGKATVELATAASLTAQARTDFSVFLSLQTLSPIILKTDTTGQALLKQSNEALAQQWEADQALTPEQRDAGLQTFTNSYLLDRQALLQYSIVANIKDAVADPYGYVSIQGARPTENNLRFIDIGSGTLLQVYTSRPSPSTAPSQYVIFGNDSANTITGSAQGDRLYGGGGTDTVNSSDGDDYLEGNAGNDSLDGGGGIDTLLGGAGDDTLAGGQGHDLLVGGADNDTYYFEGSIGLDIVRDVGGVGRIVVAAPGFEALSGGKKLAEGAWISDDKKYTYALIEGNLVIRPGADSGASGFIFVQSWKNGDLGITLSDTPAESVTPTTTLTGDFIKQTNEAQTQYVLGPDGNYQSVGSATGALDLIKAGDTGALIQGLGGQDALFGGNGSDIIEGGDGGDQLFGSLGRDTIRGGAGVDFIYGSDGGSTTYPLTVQPPPASPPSEDWIPGFNWVSWSLTTDADGFKQWYYSDELMIVRQVGDAGNVIEGGAGNDVIAAGTGFDVVHGQADNDNIIGEGGNDVLFGDDGNDRIFGDASYAQHGQDVLDGGLGDDILLGQGDDDAVYGGRGNDTLYGDDRTTTGTPVAVRGNDYLDGGTGDDVLYGNEGDDILIGGADDDVIYGGAGKDIYIFNKGDGVDTVVDTKDGNIFRFGTGISKDNIKLYLGSLALDLGGGDQIHVEGFDANDALNTVAIGTFEFADGSVLTSTELLARGFDIDGTAADDILTGTSVTDRINGLAGNDSLAGGAGDDTLDGGEGNDTLIAGSGADTMTGGDGSDTFVVNAGAGAVTITDAGGLDLIQFGAGISLGTLSGSFDDNSMVMTFGGGESVTVTGNVSFRFADGRTIANLYDANGSPTGSSVKTEDAYGSITNLYSSANGAGAKLGDTWTTVRGGYGGDTFNADGSSSGIAYHVDGTYGTYTDDGAGTRLNEAFNSSGFKTGDNWVHPDGTWGNDVFGPNGSSSGVAHNPDGTYSTYTDDGHGHVQTMTYDASGHPILLDDGVRTYPNTRDAHFADGSHRVTVEYAPGESTSTLFGAGGAKLGGSWTKADGSHGSESFGVDGSSEGVVYQADGSYETFQKDGSRQTITKDYSAQGALLSSAITEVDGLNSITTFRDTAGVKIKEVWVQPDGSTGTDIVGPLDFNGLSNFVARTYARDFGYYEQWQTPDGAGGDHSNGGTGDVYGSWYIPDPVNSSKIEAYSWENIQARGVDAQEAFFNFDVVDFGPQDRDYYVYQYYIPLRTAAAWDRTVVAQYVFKDINTGVRIFGELNRYGQKYLGDSSQLITPSVGVAQTPVLKTFSGTGGYDVFNDDGQGNVLVTGYSLSGVRLGDMWVHNDGSYGVNTYGLDGSSTGVSANPGGFLMRFTIDAQGNVTSTDYPGAAAITGTVPYAPPPAVVAPPARPPGIGAPAGGSSNAISHTYTNEDWIAYVLSSPDDNDCDQERIVYDANGAILSRTVVHTDPGYDAAVTNGGGFTGWTYDDTGLPIARYIDDGQGTVETFTFDAQRHVSGRHVAATGADGTVTTTAYDGGGRLMGFSVQTRVAADQTNIDSYDAAGRPSGRSVEYSDGDGNSVVSRYDAAGVLLSTTAKVVDGGGNRSTITSYGGNGLPTSLIITAVSPEGVIQTDNYDANGQLTGSVVAAPDSAGNIKTVNYDASGAVLSYVTLRTGADLSTVLTTYDAQARKVREDVLMADGRHSNAEYSPDGSNVTTTVAIDGSYTTVVRDASGGEVATLFTAAGTKLSDSWSRGDGSHGSDTFNADGSSAGLTWYRDGSGSSFVTTVSGEITTTQRAANGAIAGTLVTKRTADEALVVSFSPQGTRFLQTWWRSDGSTGRTHLGSTGLVTLYEWTGSDGTHGFDVPNPDGSSIGSIVQRDGTYTLYVSDGRGTSTIQHFNADGVLLETTINHSPRSESDLGEASIQAGSEFSHVIGAGLFTDEDPGDVLRYTARQAGNHPLPAWLHFDPVTATFSGVPSNRDAGSLIIEVVATDSEGASAGGTFLLSVARAQISGPAIAGQAATEDQGWSFTAPAFSDENPAETLTYTAALSNGAALPSWLVFDAATRTFTGTPANEDVGALSVKVTATNSTGASAGIKFSLAVSNVNDAPALAHAVGDQAATEDQAWSFTVLATAFSDVDAGDTLVWRASLADNTALPSWLSFDAGTRTFSGIPANSDVGSISVQVAVADGSGAGAGASFTVAIANANDAPVAVGSLAQWSLLSGDAATYAVSADSFMDVDVGDTRTYSATLAGGNALPAWLGFDASTLTFNGTPSSDDSGDFVLNVIAADAGGLSAYQSIRIHVESADLDLRGTAVADLLVGGDGDDHLDGLADADQMHGGKGDDTYVVDNDGDAVTELAGEGFDTVHSSISHTLAAQVEKLVLTEQASSQGPAVVLPPKASVPGLDGTGNELDNVLIGNSQNNVLTAGAGNDILDGREGNDRLVGGAGDDTYVLGRGWDRNTIVEDDDTALNSDVALFEEGISHDQLWFRKSGNDLEVTVLGTNDVFIIDRWYKGEQHHVEQFKTSDGKVLLDSQVRNLVDAMASFSPPSSGQTTLPPNYQGALGVVIAASWQ